MTEDLIKGLWGILAGDVNLTSKLATYSPPLGSPGPAIFTTNPAPRGADMPYIVIGLDDATPEDSPILERLICTIDTYVRSGSRLPALAIGQRLEKLWDFQTPVFTGVTMLGMMRGVKGFVNEDDTEIQHLHQQFLIRYCRDDLYNA